MKLIFASHHRECAVYTIICMDTFKLDVLLAAQRVIWPRLSETSEHFVLYG